MAISQFQRTMVRNSLILSLGVSKQANERAQLSMQAKRAVRNKQMSEQCKRTRKRTSKRPSTSVCILGWSGPQCIPILTKRSGKGMHKAILPKTSLSSQRARLIPMRNVKTMKHFRKYGKKRANYFFFNNTCLFFSHSIISGYYSITITISISMTTAETHLYPQRIH